MSIAPLYGLPEAENLHDDPLGVVRQWIEYRFEPITEPTEVKVEEWSAVHLRRYLPDAESAAEWLVEYCCMDEADEWAAECMSEAASHPDVVSAFARALIVLGDHFGTTYRMADALLRTITYIVQPDGSVVEKGSSWSRRARP